MGLKEPTSNIGPVRAEYLVATLPASLFVAPAAHSVTVYKPYTKLATNAVTENVIGPLSVSISAPAATVLSGLTIQFTSTITNYLGDPSVKFSVAGPGSIDAVSGLYSPETVTANTPATVLATSNEDSTKSASLGITVVVPDPTSENFYCANGDVWIGPATDGPAALPTNCIYTGLDGTPSPGATTVVPAGGKVQAALAAANCGDTIKLTAGATYSQFTLPLKSCDANHWITIRTNAPDSVLSPEHSRIDPNLETKKRRTLVLPKDLLIEKRKRS